MNFVDRLNGVAGNLGRKAPCRVATTGPITLAGLQVIDGVQLVDGDRVLVKNQSDKTENGIYDASTGNWSRSRDFNGNRDIVPGTDVLVVEGTANARIGFVVVGDAPIVIGSSEIDFEESAYGLPGSITNTKLADMPEATVKGRLPGLPTGSAQDLHMPMMCASDFTSLQDAIDEAASSGVPLIVNSEIEVSSTVTLKPNVDLIITGRGSVRWTGASGGKLFDTPSDGVLWHASLICDGGNIDMGNAGLGLHIRSAQFSKFDLLFSGTNQASTVVLLDGDTSGATWSITENKNCASNEFVRIMHSGYCGTILKLDGKPDAIVTLNNFGQIRAAFNYQDAIVLSGWSDTNQFGGLINVRLEADNLTAVVFDDIATVYQNDFFQFSVGAYGPYTGRRGAYFGNGTKHNTIQRFFVDGDLGANAVVAHPDVKSYYCKIHTLAALGERILEKGYSIDALRMNYSSVDGSVLIGDDAAISFRLLYTQGILIINSTNGDCPALVYASVAGSAACVKVAGSVYVEVTTGVLSGTTGTDNRMTISASTNGLVYIENRTGAAIRVSWAIVAGFM